MAPIEEKRIACLYRVSTAKQIDDNDIPMQKKACRQLIDQHDNWHICNEYYEKGVSAYKTDVADRDVIQNILKDAQSKKFDILVLFMSDRLCRNDNYMPTLKKLSKYVEVWACDKGDITIRNHTDSLKASIDGWQNEGESIKISLRTDTKHKQMTEDGEFRGGKNPYGYKFVKSGKYNTRDKKQRKELFELVIDEKESEVVKTIFNLAYEKGYGGNRIASYLNEHKIPSRENKNWAMPTINYILRNPIYKGYPTYGKKTCKEKTQINQSEDKWTSSKNRIDTLAIIPEDIWDSISLMRKARNPKKNFDSNECHISNPTKGSLLFVGFIKCGYCGSPLVTTHHNKSWTTKDGQIKTSTSIKYRCSGKQSGKVQCNGGSIYSQEKIEEPIMQYVDDFFVQFEHYDFTKDIQYDNTEELNELKKEQKELIILKEEIYKDIETLEDKIPKALRGQCEYTNEKLSELLKRQEHKLSDVRNKLEQIDFKLKQKNNEINEIKIIVDLAPSWKTLFYALSLEQKKVVLACLIDYIQIRKDGFKVKFKVHVKEFARQLLGEQFDKKWESKLSKLTPTSIYEKLIKIDLEKYLKAV